MTHKALFTGFLLLFFACFNAHANSKLCNNSALKKPMKATFVPLNNKRILLLAGGIKSDSDKIVRAAIHNKRAYQEVWLCSGGGSVKAGKGIGRALNSARATVKVPDYFFCASACTIAFMGGYARIIEPKAQFVTHASSRFSSFGKKVDNKGGVSYSRLGFFDCNKPWAKQFCQRLRIALKNLNLYKKEACPNLDTAINSNGKCSFFDSSSNRGNYIFANALLAKVISRDKQLIRDTIEIGMRQYLESELDLLHYFQTMLLDGHVKYTNQSVYSNMKNRLSLVNIYDLEKSDVYQRDFDADTLSLKDSAGNLKQMFAVWQTMLTDSELSVKAQIISYIRRNTVDLGLASADALKMYDSMRTCQIQSSCQLEPHSARALGYHNMSGYE